MSRSFLPFLGVLALGLGISSCEVKSTKVKEPAAERENEEVGEIESDKTSYAAGESALVSYDGASHEQAWVGLYAADSENLDYEVWVWVDELPAGSVTLQIPANLETGQYEFRLFKDSGYDLFATSVTVSITGAE
jgi:hypothetical protein